MPPFKLKVAHDSTQVCSLNQTIYTRAPSPHFSTTFWPVCMRACSKFSPDALFWFPFIYDPIISASPSSTLRYWTKSHHGNLSVSSMRVWHQHLQIQSLDYFSIKILLNGFPAFWALCHLIELFFHSLFIENYSTLCLWPWNIVTLCQSAWGPVGFCRALFTWTVLKRHGDAVMLWIVGK